MIIRKGKNFRSSLSLILIVRAGNSPIVAINIEMIRILGLIMIDVGSIT
jgi:hypothetical protein